MTVTVNISLILPLPKDHGHLATQLVTEFVAFFPTSGPMRVTGFVQVAAWSAERRFEPIEGAR